MGNCQITKVYPKKEDMHSNRGTRLISELAPLN